MSTIPYMTYMNVRHQLPTIGIRQEQARLDSAPFRPAEMHRDYRPAKTTQHATQVKVDIDQYPSRQIFGYYKPGDYKRKMAQEGMQNAQETTSKHSRGAWEAATNAAKPGRNIPMEEVKANLREMTIKTPQWDLKRAPDPEFTVTPSRIEGEMDPGSDEMDIQTTATPDFEYTPGSAETYLKDKGFIRMWMTQGYIDVEA